MSDHTTRLALWSMQGQRHCMYCGAKIYTSVEPGGLESLQHVDEDIGGRPRVAAHMPYDLTMLLDRVEREAGPEDCARILSHVREIIEEELARLPD